MVVSFYVIITCVNFTTLLTSTRSHIDYQLADINAMPYPFLFVYCVVFPVYQVHTTEAKKKNPPYTKLCPVNFSS